MGRALVRYRVVEETSACLVYAALRRDKQLFRKLLQRHERGCSSRDSRGATILRWVCGSFCGTWCCMDAGIVVCFHLEQRSGRIQLLELVLKRQNVDVTAKGKE